MSGFNFNVGNLPIRLPSPASVSKSFSNAYPEPKDRRVCESYMLVFDSPILRVRVGTGHGLATFPVHETLFTSRSEFFKRATSKDLQGNEVYVVALPDDDPNTFRLYLNLVYANQLVTKGTEQWLKLCQLYVLADKLQDITSKNQIIDGMHIFFNELVLKTPLSVDTQRMLPAAATAKLYEGTPDRSQARKLLLDLYTDFGDESWLRTEQAELPAEFICDVAVRLLQKRARIVFGSQISRLSSRYHEVSVSPPGATDTVTGDVKEAPTDKRSDTVKVVTIAEEKTAKKSRTSENTEPEWKLENSGVTAPQVATPAVDDAPPQFKGLTTKVK